MTEVINVKILHLVLKKKWYEMQESGEKNEEYREITPYWCNMLLAKKSYSRRFWKDILGNIKTPYQHLLNRYNIRDYTHVCFHYGYTQRCFINRIDSITIGRGYPEWGAPEDRDVFIIKHHREPSPFVVGKDFER